MESELIQFSTATAFPPAGCRIPPLSTAAASSINELFIKNKFLEGQNDTSAIVFLYFALFVLLLLLIKCYYLYIIFALESISPES